MPVVEHLQEITLLVGREWRQAPAIQDQERDARQGLRGGDLAAFITAREQQGVEPPWQTKAEVDSRSSRQALWPRA